MKSAYKSGTKHPSGWKDVSTVLTEEGQVMKIPNTILATDAAIIDYTVTETKFVFNLRYEFPITCEPDIILSRMKEELKGFPLGDIFVNEQSDKQYYTVKAIFFATEGEHARIKSEALKRFMKVHNELLSRVSNVEKR